ncbi:MAG: DNA polymerase III subunit beta, partial [bacterium]
LAQALSLVGGVATKNNNLPILGNVLIKVDSQKSEVISTNLEVAITVNVRSKIEQEGTFTVPARTLLDYINLLPDDKIDFELKENELLVKCGKTSTKIKGTPADEYPVIPPADGGKGYLIKVDDLKKALPQIVPSAAKSDIRPELSGVLFDFKNNALILAATDSYRLAEKKIPTLQGSEECRVIVPGRTATEIGHILSTIDNIEDGEKNVRILIGESQVVVNYGNVQMVSRLVDGQYPDYTQIIPKEFKTTAEFSSNQMVKEIKAASLFTTTGVNAISVDLNTSQGSIGISSTSTQTGEYNSEISAEIKGDENSILLNHRYVLDGLNSMGSETTVLKAVNGDSPCVLMPKGDESYLYIVMPIRK